MSYTISSLSSLPYFLLFQQLLSLPSPLFSSPLFALPITSLDSTFSLLLLFFLFIPLLLPLSLPYLLHSLPHVYFSPSLPFLPSFLSSPAPLSSLIFSLPPFLSFIFSHHLFLVSLLPPPFLSFFSSPLSISLPLTPRSLLPSLL